MDTQWSGSKVIHKPFGKILITPILITLSCGEGQPKSYKMSTIYYSGEVCTLLPNASQSKPVSIRPWRKAGICVVMISVVPLMSARWC